MKITTEITKEEIEALRSIQYKLYMASFNSGWHKAKTSIEAIQNKELASELMAYYNATKIALIHSEISEALEGLRKGLMDDHLKDRSMLEVELADAIIRILDMAGSLNLDVASAVAEKNEYNQKRADHKLENRSKTGGKKF